ncbi:MAG: hypothetical protein ABI844_14890, partial [Saprospiraceae bacterium]
CLNKLALGLSCFRALSRTGDLFFNLGHMIARPLPDYVIQAGVFWYSPILDLEYLVILNYDSELLMRFYPLKTAKNYYLPMSLGR